LTVDAEADLLLKQEKEIRIATVCNFGEYTIWQAL
jgi:hypothetical protein